MGPQKTSLSRACAMYCCLNKLIAFFPTSIKSLVSFLTVSTLFWSMSFWPRKNETFRSFRLYPRAKLRLRRQKSNWNWFKIEYWRDLVKWSSKNTRPSSIFRAPKLIGSIYSTTLNVFQSYRVECTIFICSRLNISEIKYLIDFPWKNCELEMI